MEFIPPIVPSELLTKESTVSTDKTKAELFKKDPPNPTVALASLLSPGPSGAAGKS